MLSDATLWYAEIVEMALATAARPWAIALGLAGLTLLFEDAAIAAGILLAADGTIGLPLAAIAVAGGIAGGDMLLYVFGLGARRISIVRRRLVDSSRSQVAHRLLNRNMVTAVMIARVVPGLRLAVYTASGLFAVPWLPFFSTVLVAVAVWTGVLFALGSAVGIALTRHWGVAFWQAAVVIFVSVVLTAMLAGRMAAAIQRIKR